MIERKAKVENENGRDANSHQPKVLVDAKEKDGQCGQGVFHNEEFHIPVTNKEIHKGIDFLGPVFEMKNRKVNVKDAEKHYEKQGEEKSMAVAVYIQVRFSVLLPPD